MRLAPRGDPGRPAAAPPGGGASGAGAAAAATIVHFSHYKRWRLAGVAHELAGRAYEVANATLITSARGRAKEFKDR